MTALYVSQPDEIAKVRRFPHSVHLFPVHTLILGDHGFSVSDRCLDPSTSHSHNFEEMDVGTPLSFALFTFSPDRATAVAVKFSHAHLGNFTVLIEIMIQLPPGVDIYIDLEEPLHDLVRRHSAKDWAQSPAPTDRISRYLSSGISVSVA